MARSPRITGLLLDGSACLSKEYARGEKLYGLTIMKATRRSVPTVYGALERLEDRNWITGYWEDQDLEPSKPRRRFCRLTLEGSTGICDLLAKRRPEALL